MGILGITRSKELINMLHKCWICISYNYLLLLYVILTLRDVETSNTCPLGIAYGKPPIVIVDNNNFKTDTLIGNASGAHRINVLYVPAESRGVGNELVVREQFLSSREGNVHKVLDKWFMFLEEQVLVEKYLQ